MVRKKNSRKKKTRKGAKGAPDATTTAAASHEPRPPSSTEAEDDTEEETRLLGGITKEEYARNLYCNQHPSMAVQELPEEVKKGMGKLSRLSLDAMPSDGGIPDDVIDAERKNPCFEDIMSKLPPRQECPICMLPIPFSSGEIMHMGCCGQLICLGCIIQDSLNRGDGMTCAFCREPLLSNADDKRAADRHQRQIDKNNDAKAMASLASMYEVGMFGVAQDKQKAMELWEDAAENGSTVAAFYLARLYEHDPKQLQQIGSQLSDSYEHDPKKQEYYLRLAADGGDVFARVVLADLMGNRGEYRAAMVHHRVAASFGHARSLEFMKNSYKDNCVSKEVLESTLRSFQRAQEEMTSKGRELARTYIMKRGFKDPLSMAKKRL